MNSISKNLNQPLILIDKRRFMVKANITLLMKDWGQLISVEGVNFHCAG